MFSIRYAGDIQSRKERSISAATARTLAELPTTLKKPQKKSTKKFAPSTPQSFDEAFPATLPSSNSAEIDEAILLDLQDNFLQGESIFHENLRQSQLFYNSTNYISPQDEQDFLEFHFLNDSGWYQECPECLLNFHTDCTDAEKCTCHNQP